MDASNSYQNWKSDCSARSSRILCKTQEEVDASVLHGPFHSVNEWPFIDPGITPRRGIWECHGDAEVPGVRNIDDLLFGEQTSFAGSTYSCRPTDIDASASQVQFAVKRSPNETLVGWSSYFSKAYKQVPGVPDQVADIVLAQYNPVQQCVAMFVAFSRVFGSRTSPTMCSRYPSLFCFLRAVLFQFPATHCVDDVIFVEEEQLANAGKHGWDTLMLCLGWKMAPPRTWRPRCASPSLAFLLISRPCLCTSRQLW